MPGEEWRAVTEENRRDLTESGIWDVPAFTIGATALWGRIVADFSRRILAMSEGSNNSDKLMTNKNNTMPLVLFSHGQESGPWGTKITRMAQAVQAIGCEADSIDYQGIADPTARVRKLLEIGGRLPQRLILVGSSMGGHVATAAAVELNALGLFVLAPAYFMPGFEALTPAPPALPITIVHGWRDDVVPVANSIRYAQDARATLHVLDGDHRLTENIHEINLYLVQFIKRLTALPGEK
ncbi:MAG: alpha/beta fold hydrolase [Woeseia sp.]